MGYLALLIAVRGQLDKGKIPMAIGLWWVHGLFLAIGLLLFYWEPLRLKLASSVPVARWRMVKLDRYIGVTVFVAILAVLGVILGLALLFAFIDELNDISASYGIGDALRFIFLTAPRRAYDMLPMAALIGCLVGLGTLASNSELTIMRAAGVSPVADRLGGDETDAGADAGRHPGWRVRRALTENIAQSGAPGPGRRRFAKFKRGLWHRQGREYIHINAVQPNGVLYGVTRYRFDEQRGLESASFAKRARFETDHWQLEEVTTTLLHPREKRSGWSSYRPNAGMPSSARNC